MTTSKRQNKKGAKPSSASELLLQLQLESNPGALCLVRAVLQRATEELHFAEEESRSIVRAVDEALANVINHAYQGRKGESIGLTCRRLRRDKDARTSEGLEIILTDHGVPVDDKKLKSRALEDVRPGGLGLHFIRQSMDVVEFSRKHNKNVLRLVKYLAPSGQERKLEGD